MTLRTKIVQATAENIDEHPQVICFINPKSEFYAPKRDRLIGQFKNRLEIELLYIEGVKRPVGLHRRFGGG